MVRGEARVDGRASLAWRRPVPRQWDGVMITTILRKSSWLWSC